jgi:hypothetical protein
MAPAVRQHPEARPPGSEVLMAEISLARSVQESPELVECSRHEGKECPRCDGSGFRPRKRCAGCGEPAGRPSEGGKALLGTKNSRDKDQPLWCLNCHPDSRFWTPTGRALRGWTSGWPKTLRLLSQMHVSFSPYP